MNVVDPTRLLPRTLTADQGKAKDESHEGGFDREVQHYWAMEQCIVVVPPGR